MFFQSILPVGLQEGLHLLLVLPQGDGAGAVAQGPAGMNQPGAAFKQRRLGPAQGVYILRLPVQGYVRLLP